MGDEKNKSGYPPELWTATRAEYVTRVKQYNKDKKKPGCPLILMMFAFLVLVVAVWYFTYGYQFFSLS